LMSLQIILNYPKLKKTVRK